MRREVDPSPLPSYAVFNGSDSGDSRRAAESFGRNMGVVTTFNKGMIMEIDQTGNTYGFLFSQDVQGNIVVTVIEKDAGERDVNGRLIKIINLTGDFTAKQCIFSYNGNTEGMRGDDLMIGFSSCSNIVIVKDLFFFPERTEETGFIMGYLKDSYYDLKIRINNELPLDAPSKVYSLSK